METVTDLSLSLYIRNEVDRGNSNEYSLNFFEDACEVISEGETRYTEVDITLVNTEKYKVFYR